MVCYECTEIIVQFFFENKLTTIMYTHSENIFEILFEKKRHGASNFMSF
jgi:hypothetical protein